MKCNLCPRKCNVDRQQIKGFCGQTNNPKLAKAGLFFWEEPVVSGKNGSGAVFFCGCNLKCCFCQNYQISSGNFGKEISVERLAKIFEELEQQGAENINLVSPSHFANQIVEALKIYKPNIPIVYNSNGFEDVETIKTLKNLVDVFLVDIKFFDSELSQKYCKASNYFDVCSKAVLQMLAQQPQIVLQNGTIQKGVVVRHLVMPNCTQDSKKILDWLKQHTNDNILLSIMGQYTPCHNAKYFEEINRKITPLEYKIVINHAKKLGLTSGFVQDLESASQKYIPVWDLKGV